MIDLEAILARKEHLRLSLVRTSVHFAEGAYEERFDALKDINALLAEVDRLRNGHVVLSCACGHGPENHVVTRSCCKCPSEDVIFDWRVPTHLPFGKGKHEDRVFISEYLNEPVLPKP